MNIQVKTPQEIEIMRQGARIWHMVEEAVKDALQEGTTLLKLDEIAEQIIRSQGAKPSFKGYQGFPATLCTMVNSEVVHGIPGDKKLRNGDLVSIDCGVLWKGLHVDAAFSQVVGGDAENPARAVFSDCVKRSLLAGCAQAKPGNHVGDIGAAIEHVVQEGGYAICREYTGHGVGRQMHEDPHIFNYGPKGSGPRLVTGMTLAIEPIVASGNPKVKILGDTWTVVTVDGRDACQWEHCGVVTPDGFEIFC